MNMPLSNIKYKITTKRGLKPDTFKNYIEYVFNNFLEDEAKILVNNFVGNLGLKYTRNSKGFICKSYDCAIWNSLPMHIKAVSSFQSFKQLMKSLLRDKQDNVTQT